MSFKSHNSGFNFGYQQEIHPNDMNREPNYEFEPSEGMRKAISADIQDYVAATGEFITRRNARKRPRF